MIKFFRKIRYDLMNQNKTTKYFKYAIGEIILVVIGILIALQINNWNTNRKLKLKENQILNEIVNSIDNDTKLYKDIFDLRLERKKNGIDSLLLYIGNNKSIKDNLFMKLLSQSGTDIKVRFDSGPYDALKSSGFDIIKNDSLRAKIINAYEIELPAYSGFVESYNNEKNPEIIDYKQNIIESYVTIDNTDQTWRFRRRPKFENVLKNQEFLELLNLENQKYYHYQSRLKSLKRVLNQVKSQILTELDND